MSYYKKIIILSQIAKNANFEREATGIVKLERIGGSVSGRAALLNISPEGLYVGIKCKNLPLQSFALSDEPETVFTLHSASEIEDAICIVARDTAAGFSPVLSGMGGKKGFSETFTGSFVRSASAAARKVSREEAAPEVKNAEAAPVVSRGAADVAAHNAPPAEISRLHTRESAPVTPPEPVAQVFSAALPPVTQRFTPPPVPPVSTMPPINDEQIAEANYFEAAAALADEVKPRARSHNYYRSISAELEELFSTFPPEVTLNKLIEGSYFAHINYVGDKYYCVGLISAGDEPQYIVYAVPGTYSAEPPAELKDSCRWLPARYSDYTGTGYWVMYQDTDTGATITDII